MKYRLFVMMLSICLPAAPLLAQSHGEREVIKGVFTQRVVEGEPYQLSGNRVIFANWYYIQPGDLDWRDDQGKSVYVNGSSDLYGAHFIGINAPRGITIKAEKPVVKGPLQMPHRCIIQEGKLLKGWTDNEYYESSDGMNWVKKANLQLQGIPDGIYHVFIDPSAPASERYKAVFTDEITKQQFDAYRKTHPDGWEPRALLHTEENNKVACIKGAVSPDGIKWTALPDPLVVEYSDTLNTAYYNPITRKYVMFTRYWSMGAQAPGADVNIRNSWTGIGRRAIGRSESSDFRSFAPSTCIIEPTPDMLPSEVLYTNCFTTAPGDPDCKFMFPTIWNASVDDTTRIGLLSSHDDRVWHWVPAGDLLSTALFGQWNGGCVWAMPNLVELPSGDWALPYMGHNIPHKYPRNSQVGGVGWAVWPKGRLIGIDSPSQGEFTMIAVIPPGNILKINAVTKRAGSIVVEATGKDGRSFNDCIPIVGDQMWTTVKWEKAGNLGIQRGQAVTLKFRLNMATIYGLEFN